ncbi:hypothetical protein [Pseudomonas aeruginosa]|uniref:hypothetical protein n=1 Tax=Pseudomonas aeruginosa TaxID=287 RepID=UPI0029C01B75|nr:hypothetical protein [Pseudomonas aeruginosa]HEK0835491.1 hypothetical protein [Pseudomonas aeruginosa]HEK0923678.1 hypothetical protein [Pseudomonas aeruginosa]HEK2251231.1 hypothetical protein [Pseudomonas aeruginosa]HEK2279494.1 hypothetical protein [Pseudomonas aeruginosa]
MSKPAPQVLGVQGFSAGGMMGEDEPAPASAGAPELDELAKVRNRMRARLAGMSNTYIKRRGLALTIDGEVTVAQLEALLFMMLDSEEWQP